jgi:phosphoglycolate phosphatase
MMCLATDNLVVFDLDGTLYRTDLTIVESVYRAANDLGLARPGRDKILSLGETAEKYALELLPAQGEEIRRLFLERLRYHERALIPQVGRLFGGVEKLLNELSSAGFALAVCSNSSIDYIRLVLSSCRILDRFSQLSGREPGADKSERLGRLIREIPSSNTVMVGDRVHDLNAARDNRIPFIGVTYGYAPHEVDQAELIAESPSELLGSIMLARIFTHIESELRRKQPGPVIVGINGIDNSGKTVFSKSLARYLSARSMRTQLIHLDDFHNPRLVRMSGNNEVESYITNAFDLNSLEARLLKPAHLCRKVNAEITHLDLETDEFSITKQYDIDADNVVLIEGTLLFREPIDPYLHYRVFLDVTFDEAERRAETRDIARFGPQIIERYRTKYFPIQKWYLARHEPRKRADLVIDNNDYNLPKAVRFSG